MSFTFGLHRAVQQQPHAIATVAGGRRRGWLELADRVARLAAGLADFKGYGLKAGHRVAALALNGDAVQELMLATAWLDAEWVPLNPRFGLDELCAQLNACEAVAVLLDDRFAEHADALFDACPFLRFALHAGEQPSPDGLIPLESLIDGREPRADARSPDGSVALWLRSGGTTGPAQAVRISHAQLASAAGALLAEGYCPEGAVLLRAVPDYQPAALALAAAALQRGARQVFLPAFQPAPARALIDSEGISDALLTPAMLQALLAEGPPPPSLQRVLLGPGPIAPELLTRAATEWPAVRVQALYGLAEACGIVALQTASTNAWRCEAAGRSLTHVELALLDDAGQPVESGVIGEIALRGGSVSTDFPFDPERQQQAAWSGWLRSGDLARLDSEGQLQLAGRVGIRVERNGRTLPLLAVERALARHPAIAAVAVIGAPAADGEAQLHAVIVPAAGAEPELAALQQWCADRLDPDWTPASLELRARLPVSATGDVMRGLLQTEWLGRQAEAAPISP